MQDQETPVQGETQTVGALGTEATPATVPESTDGTEIPAEQPQVEEPAVSLDELKAQIEAERKERQKAEMRANQLENKQKEAELSQLKEAENYKELYERAEAEKSALEEARAQEEAVREARKFRDDTIASYPDEKVRRAAQALITKNESALAWGDVDSWDSAKSQLVEQLDAIKEVVSPETSPEVHPNNPAPQVQTGQQMDRKSAVDNAAKNRDFSSLLKDIPSVAAQIEQMQD
jgi:chromosome segregation ATPase